jgi:hypothetical protein
MPTTGQLAGGGTACQLMMRSCSCKLGECYFHEHYETYQDLDFSFPRFKTDLFLNDFYCLQPVLVNALNSILIVLFALLHIADGIVTYFGLSFAGVEEVNPLVSYFIGVLGLGYSIVLLKLICLMVIGTLYIKRRTIKSLWGTTSLACAASFYVWVVNNNVSLLISS